MRTPISSCCDSQNPSTPTTLQSDLTHSLFCFPDKQQELDLPTLRQEDAMAEAAAAPKGPRQQNKSERARGPSTMSQISGINRKPLCHTNSFTGERLPQYGVETPYEEELSRCLNEVDRWGVDIFRIGKKNILKELIV